MHSAQCTDEWEATITRPETANNAKRRTLTDQVYSSLRSGVIQGRLEPGSRLNQLDVATKLDVSERTAREALTQLVSEALVSREPYTELRVAVLSTEEIAEILHMRILLEGWAMELAALDITQEELDRMHVLLPQIKAKTSMASTPTLRGLCREFECIALNACNKKYLRQMVLSLVDRMLPYSLVANTAEEYARQMRKMHDYLRQLLDALETGDGKKAREILIAHLNEMGQSLGAE